MLFRGSKIEKSRRLAVLAGLLMMGLFMLTGTGVMGTGETVFANGESYDPPQAIVLPGRVQQQQGVPDMTSEERQSPQVQPLRAITPAPHWTSQPPVFETNIPAGAVFSVALTSPLTLYQLRPGDYIEFETVSAVISGDGRWMLPVGSKVNAKVTTLSTSESRKRKGRLGLTFYEIITPNGWVIPFSGSLLAYPVSKKKALQKQQMALMLDNQPPVGMEGAMIIPLKKSAWPDFFPGDQSPKTFEAGHRFSVRVGRAIYFGPMSEHQMFANASQTPENVPDRGVVPVRYFSKDAVTQIEQYQDEHLMPLPYQGVIGEE
ncbi:MAG: hypothetical protein VKJ04_08360 [Vampirovibrionales bacterium]|nr:hypothetical protein [Vampirovibrionales bacterium]